MDGFINLYIINKDLNEWVKWKRKWFYWIEWGKARKKGVKRWLIKTGLKQHPQSGAINSKENHTDIQLSNLQAYELYSL